MCSKTTRVFLLPLSVAVGLAATIAAVPTLIDNVIEIDGNVADVGGPGTDWNVLNGDCTKPEGGSGQVDGSLARTCIASEDPPKIFTMGGSKDPNDVSQWHWKNADTVPDKDAITHGFAASFLSGGDKILAMGGDRFAVNGDANIGAWFFQQAVGLKGDGTFSGVHVNKDVFLVSAFVNGGGVSVIQAYEWDSSCTGNFSKTPSAGQCADNNLRYLGSANTAAITNSTTINTESWSYKGKFGIPDKDMPPGAFFEGAADLTKLFAASGQGDVPCFSSFLLETRSSQEPSAVLKDFVLGGFPECKVTITTNCACATVDGNTASYTFGFGGTVSNDGGGTLSNVHVLATVPGVANPIDYDCGTLGPKGGATATKNWPSQCTPTSPNTFSTLSPPASTSAYATASTGFATIKSDTASKTCIYNATDTPGCFLNPGIKVEKICSTAIVATAGVVAVKVNFSGTVSNTQSEALVNVSVSEDNNNDGSVDIANLTLAGCTSGNGTPGSACTLNIGGSATFSGNYLPNAFVDLEQAGIKGRAKFADKVVATGTGKVSGTTVSDNFTAECVVCPLGSCPI